MTKKAIVIGLLLLTAGGAALAYSRRSPAPDAPDEPRDAFDPGAASFIDSIEQWTQQNILESEIFTMPLPDLPQAGANIAAMQSTISHSEGTAKAGDPYRVCFAYKHTIVSFADHPAVTGEWRGEPLSDAMCAGAGLGPGCVSTAAGKYQIIKPTWLRLKAKLSLPDFSPESQDAACIQLLRERGALTYLEQGRFADAVHAARKEWASLSGAGYGQGERSIEWLTARFTESGGVLA